MPSSAEAHRADMERGADRLLLAGKLVVRRAAGPGCGCCKDLDAALAKHTAEELCAGIAAVTTEATLSLDGEARRCARISSVINRAEAVLAVIRDHELKQRPGMIPAFRKAVDRYAGTHDADDGDGVGVGDAEAPPVEDVIPWPHEVDGAEVLDAVVVTIQRHVNLPPTAAHAVALWAAFSHALDLCWFNPRLAICSPVKRCGKTTLVEVLTGLVARAKPSSGVTPAVVFRMIDLWKPTYLIDEADGYLPNNDELRSVLNSSHTRTGAKIDRNVKDPDGDWVPKSFSTWCPLVVAGIGRLPGTLDDRSIKIRLQRKPRDIKLVRFRADRVAGISDLGRMLARFVLDNQIAIREADIEPPEKLHDRSADNWRPLAAVAAAAGGEWPERAAAAALALEQPDHDVEDLCIELLDDIRRIYILRPNTKLSERKRVYRAVATNDAETTHQVKLFTSEIMQALLAMQERPWSECNHGKALSQRGMATLLRSFSITTHKNVRRGAKTAKGFALDEFLAAFVSYLPPLFPHQGSQGHRPRKLRATA
jgi:putative DNA primase/helicase